MGAVADRIRDKLTEAFAPERIDVCDDSDKHAGHAGAREGRHFNVRIASRRFSGLARVARHRLVYDAVAPLIADGIHALAIDARVPQDI